MTKDDFFELIQEHKDYGGYVHQDALAERLAELFAAGASEGQTDVDAISERIQMRKLIKDQSAELTALRERVAGMEKDALRYRWLRGHLGRRVLVDLFGSPSGPGYTMAGIDAEIDLELEQEPKQ